MIVGALGFEFSHHAFRWTATGGMVGIDPFLDEDAMSQAYAVSHDGSVVVGDASRTGGHANLRPFRWTKATGMVPLRAQPGGQQFGRSLATAVSSDGSVVVGHGQTGSDFDTFRWTEKEGRIGLGKLRNVEWSEAHAVSSDGKVIVGLCVYVYPLGVEAFRWTAKTGMVGLGFLPGGQKVSHALAVSSDGSVVLGSSGSCSETAGLIGSGMHGHVTTIWRCKPGDEAFVWDSSHGMRSLHAVLSKDHHLDLAAWTLIRAVGISADRKTIIGQGILKDHPESWVARLDKPVNAPVAKGPGK